MTDEATESAYDEGSASEQTSAPEMPSEDELRAADAASKEKEA